MGSYRHEEMRALDKLRCGLWFDEISRTEFVYSLTHNWGWNHFDALEEADLIENGRREKRP